MNRQRKLMYCLLFLAGNVALQAKNPFLGVQTGSTPDTIKAQAKDVSNKNHWEETEFELINPSITLFQELKPRSCRLTYHNNRLFKISAFFLRKDFDILYLNFSSMFGKPEKPELLKADKAVNWYGPFKDSRFEYTVYLYQSADSTVVIYSDETQKDFRMGDLFKGSLFWVTVAIIGLFAGYMLFGYLVTSRCPKCKNRSMKVMGTTYDNPKDYDPSLFGQDIHWDQIYHYKCAKCGHERDDLYSGFWSWKRSGNSD